jgi:hypothetical protein
MEIREDVRVRVRVEFGSAAFMTPSRNVTRQELE